MLTLVRNFSGLDRIFSAFFPILTRLKPFQAPFPSVRAQFPCGSAKCHVTAYIARQVLQADFDFRAKTAFREYSTAFSGQFAHQSKDVHLPLVAKKPLLVFNTVALKGKNLSMLPVEENQRVRRSSSQPLSFIIAFLPADFKPPRLFFF